MSSHIDPDLVQRIAAEKERIRLLDESRKVKHARSKRNQDLYRKWMLQWEDRDLGDFMFKVGPCVWKVKPPKWVESIQRIMDDPKTFVPIALSLGERYPTREEYYMHLDTFREVFPALSFDKDGERFRMGQIRANAYYLFKAFVFLRKKRETACARDRMK